MDLPWIPSDAPADFFPDPAEALVHPNGLLAAGGDLSPERLIQAYRRGIFPWYDDHTPILWWSPDPRIILEPGKMYRSRRFRRRLRRDDYEVSMDRAFSEVIAHCADIRLRRDQEATWITEEMRQAYEALHHQGYAHSVEVWKNAELVGGVYGIALGRVFFGESMFSRIPDGSKIALAWLDSQLWHWGFALIDGQVPNPHLQRLGARPCPRQDFLQKLAENVDVGPPPGPWTLEIDTPEARSAPDHPRPGKTDDP